MADQWGNPWAPPTVPRYAETGPARYGRSVPWQETGPWPQAVNVGAFVERHRTPGAWDWDMPPVVYETQPAGVLARAYPPYFISVAPDARSYPALQREAINHELGHFRYHQLRPRAVLPSVEEEQFAWNFGGSTAPQDLLRGEPGQVYYGLPVASENVDALTAAAARAVNGVRWLGRQIAGGLGRAQIERHEPVPFPPGEPETRYAAGWPHGVGQGVQWWPPSVMGPRSAEILRWPSAYYTSHDVMTPLASGTYEMPWFHPERR